MQEEIGKTAGAIWDALNTRGEQPIKDLKKAVKGSEPTFDWAIGWLAREDQIVNNSMSLPNGQPEPKPEPMPEPELRSLSLGRAPCPS